VLSKSELHGQQQERLEQLVRDLRQVEGRKAEATAAFNKEIKRINEDMDTLIAEIDEGAVPMFDANGKAQVGA